MFQIEFAEKIKAHILYSVTFFPKNLVEPERPQTIWCVHVACWINMATRAKAHARDRALKNARAHTTHACTHTPTHPPPPKYVKLIGFPQQQWFRERPSVLRHTYIACIVQSYRLQIMLHRSGI